MKGWTLAVLKFWSQWVKIELKFVLFITVFTEQEMEQNNRLNSLMFSESKYLHKFPTPSLMKQLYLPQGKLVLSTGQW